jgi:hypothetical protein
MYILLHSAIYRGHRTLSSRSGEKLILVKQEKLQYKPEVGFLKHHGQDVDSPEPKTSVPRKYEVIWYGRSADENRPIRPSHLMLFQV